MSRTFSLMVISVLLTSFASSELMAAAKGGKRRKGKSATRDDPNDDKDNWGMDWYDSVDEATDWAGKSLKPVLVVITRDANDADHKAIERLASWPQAVELSKQNQFGAVEVISNQEDGERLVKKMNLKTLPAAVWLDPHGNALSGQALPDNVSFITSAVANWKTTLANIDKYYKDHLGRGDRWLLRGKLREAYIEYSLVAPFKGPDGDKARDGLTQVKAQWLKLVDMAAETPVGLSREAILKGVRREAVALNFAPTLETAITKALARANEAETVAAARKTEVADAKPNVETPVKPAEPETPRTAAVAATPASSGPAGPPPPEALESKGLAQLATASASSLGVSANERDTEDVSLDTKGLAARGDDRMKKAEALIQQATTAYRKALDDKMQRGPERNALLKDAHVKYESALNLLDAATQSKPDAAIEKVMEKVSMMMYGCLKYQSL